MGIDLKILDSEKIELSLVNYIKPLLSGICDHVYGGTRNMSLNYNEMVYCNCPLIINNLDAIGKTEARIEIYVKKISGFKDSVKLTQIRDIFVNNFINGIKLDNNYHFEHINEFSDEDDAGYNIKFINLAVTILQAQT